MKHTTSLPKSVGIMYSEVKREYFPTEAQYITEKDARNDAEVIAQYLKKLNVETYLYEGLPEVVNQIKKDKPEMILNFVDSIRGQEYLSSFIPGMLESMNIPYTGVGILGSSLNYNKFLTKDLLNSHGIPVPNFQLFSSHRTPLYQNLRFPLISKLNELHGSLEITRDAVSENEKHLRERVKYLTTTYKQEVLVEEFIIGKEVTVYVLEGVKKKVYMAEKIFADQTVKYKFSDYETEWLDSSDKSIQYKKYDEERSLRDTIKKAFSVLRMDDYGKFDIRIEESGRFYFIDANTNPYFGPKELISPMAAVLELHGVSFIETLRRLLINTMQFYSTND